MKPDVQAKNFDVVETFLHEVGGEVVMTAVFRKPQTVDLAAVKRFRNEQPAEIGAVRLGAERTREGALHDTRSE